MPKNTPYAISIGGLAFICGFGLIWHIYWLVLLSLLSLIACLMIRLNAEETEYTITAAKVAQIEAEPGAGAEA